MTVRCQRCNAENDEEVLRCGTCSAWLAAGATLVRPIPDEIPDAAWDSGRDRESTQPHDIGLADRRACTQCGAAARAEWRYCKACGSALPDATAGGGTGAWPTGEGAAGTRHVIVELRPDGTDVGRVHPVTVTPIIVGRSNGHVRVPDDSTLSARHASLEVTDARCFVRDLESTNGTFVSVRDRQRLVPGDIVLAGAQRLFYRAAGKQRGAFELVQVLRGGRRGKTFLLGRESLIVGRSDGDLRFPEDNLMSGRHAEVGWDGTGHFVRDVGSRNRTFVLVTSRRELADGDRLVLGRQLFEYRRLG